MVTGPRLRIRWQTQRLRRRTDRWGLALLKQAGAFVRTAAMQSIRKRKGISEPGEPPHSHVGRFKRSIFFALDRVAKSVAIGPLAARVGDLLELGGRATIRAVRRGRTRRRRARYRARPYMRPALAKGIEDLRAKATTRASQSLINSLR